MSPSPDSSQVPLPPAPTAIAAGGTSKRLSAPAADLLPTVVVEAGAIVGSADIGSGTFVGSGSTVEAGVVVGPRVVLLGWDGSEGLGVGRTLLQSGCVVEAGSVVEAGVRIGVGARVKTGSVVTRDVPAHAVVQGNPARVVDHVTTTRLCDSDGAGARSLSGAPRREVRSIDLPGAHDARGSLAFAEQGSPLPFVPQRVFHVYGVPPQHVRGEHAHHVCQQFLICVHGSLRVFTDDGTRRAVHLLNHPARGLYIPPLVWGSQYAFSEGAVLLVLASDPYDAEDYIREHDDFVRVAAHQQLSRGHLS